MTILEGLTRDINVLNNIKTPNGVTMKDFMENIGLPIYNVTTDLEEIVRFMKAAQNQAEEAHKNASSASASAAAAATSENNAAAIVTTATNSRNEATEDPKIEILKEDQADEEEEPAWDPTPAEE